MGTSIAPQASSPAKPGVLAQVTSPVTARLLRRSATARRVRYSRIKIMVGVIAAGIVILPTILTQVLPIPDPQAQVLVDRLKPPLSAGHLLGTDNVGRDLLSRMLHGGQVSLMIGVLAIVVSGIVGIVAGAAAGYLGGWVDSVISRLMESQLSLPLLLMLLLVVALFGASIPVITLVIAFAQWPEPARITRALVLVEREKPYIAAARVLGLGRLAIVVRHIIPNIINQALVVVFLLLAQAVLLESSLSFLGAGVQRPFPTWGRIISDGQDYITTAWWLVTMPGIAIALLVVGVNLLGDGLQDRPSRRKAAR
jgi:peptide/nickel transport system permease protein